MNRKVRIMLIMLIPILMWIITTSVLDTYSYFTSVVTDNFTVNAVSEEDIFEYVNIESINPKSISIKRKSNLNYSPLIYFQIDGDLKEYILHINPVRLGEDALTIDITHNINLKQFIQLVNCPTKDIFTGTIYIKYLNEYINNSYEIQFTRLFIINKFLYELGIQEISNLNDESQINQALNSIKNVIEVNETNQQVDAHTAVYNYEKITVNTLNDVLTAEQLEQIARDKVLLLTEDEVRAELEEKILIRKAVVDLIKEKLMQNKYIEEFSISNFNVQNISTAEGGGKAALTWKGLSQEEVTKMGITTLRIYYIENSIINGQGLTKDTQGAQLARLYSEDKNSTIIDGLNSNCEYVFVIYASNGRVTSRVSQELMCSTTVQSETVQQSISQSLENQSINIMLETKESTIITEEIQLEGQESIQDNFSNNLNSANNTQALEDNSSISINSEIITEILEDSSENEQNESPSTNSSDQLNNTEILQLENNQESTSREVIEEDISDSINTVEDTRTSESENINNIGEINTQTESESQIIQ